MEQSRKPEMARFRDELGATDEIEAQLRSIKLRRAVIACTTAEWRRAYFVDGIKRSLEERLTIKAEDASLAVKEREIWWQVERAKIERKRRLSTRMLAQLVAMLEERGMSDLVEEAKQRAEAALSCAG